MISSSHRLVFQFRVPHFIVLLEITHNCWQLQCLCGNAHLSLNRYAVRYRVSRMSRRQNARPHSKFWSRCGLRTVNCFCYLIYQLLRSLSSPAKEQLVHQHRAPSTDDNCHKRINMYVVDKCSGFRLIPLYKCKNALLVE